MIAFISGTILEKHPTKVLIDVGGLGYEVAMPISTFEQLDDAGQAVKLHTYLHVREDIMQLYGFASPDEKEMFLLLISVSGIGPKSALGMMSSITADDLQRGIRNENVTLLSTVPGVGRKTAQRLILELKDKLPVQEGDTQSIRQSTKDEELSREAVMALVSLGYGKSLAEKTVLQITQAHTEAPLSLEECIKQSLRTLTRA